MQNCAFIDFFSHVYNRFWKRRKRKNVKRVRKFYQLIFFTTLIYIYISMLLRTKPNGSQTKKTLETLNNSSIFFINKQNQKI